MALNKVQNKDAEHWHQTVRTTPMTFNPHLAYPEEILDRCLRVDRDEGEARLQFLRPILRILGSGKVLGFEAF